MLFRNFGLRLASAQPQHLVSPWPLRHVWPPPGLSVCPVCVCSTPPDSLLSALPRSSFFRFLLSTKYKQIPSFCATGTSGLLSYFSSFVVFCAAAEIIYLPRGSMEGFRQFRLSALSSLPPLLVFRGGCISAPLHMFLSVGEGFASMRAESLPQVYFSPRFVPLGCMGGI